MRPRPKERIPPLPEALEKWRSDWRKDSMTLYGRHSEVWWELHLQYRDGAWRTFTYDAGNEDRVVWSRWNESFERWEDEEP